MIEEHAHLGHVALQHLVHEGELLRVRGPIVREAAHVAAEARVRIGIGQAGDGDHRTRPEEIQQGRTRRDRSRSRRPVPIWK